MNRLLSSSLAAGLLALSSPLFAQAPAAPSAEAKPAEAKSAEGKPADGKPTEGKAAEGRVLKDLEFAKIGDRSLKLDLYLPAKVEGAPLVVWVHGGGWKGGSKDGSPFKWLTADGLAVASVGYRLSDVAVYPAQIHDVRGAVRWLKANAGKYGYRADSIGAVGGSAGGHLVALLATTHGVKELEGDVGGNADQSSKVDAVVDIYGPTDLTGIGLTDKHNSPGGAVHGLLGGPAQEKAELARLASPALFVTSDDAPLLILQGDADKVVPPVQSDYIHKAYQKEKLPSELIVLPGAGHGGPQFNTPEIRGKVRDFFLQHLRKEKSAATSTK